MSASRDHDLAVQCQAETETPSFTPAPWQVRQPGGTVVVKAEAGGYFAEVARTVSGSLNSQRRANALMIAAAPSMYAVLKRTEADTVGMGEAELRRWVAALRAEARKAMRQAEGGR